MNTVLPRRSALVVIAILALLAATACVPGLGGDGSSITPAPATAVVAAPIEKVEILVRESNPPGYTAHIVSGLPSGCARFHSAEITARSGDTITIAVKNTMPADANTVCTAIYGYHESSLDLGTDFVARQTYTVTANGQSSTFTAQ